MYDDGGLFTHPRLILLNMFILISIVFTSTKEYTHKFLLEYHKIQQIQHNYNQLFVHFFFPAVCSIILDSFISSIRSQYS